MGRMFVGRTNARSQALQLLFQAEANGRTVEEVLAGDYVISDGPLDDYARQLALGADALRHDLDGVISMRSRTWSLRRINAVDRNLLRLAIYEMVEEPEVDVPVTIDECVELAKAYGTDESSRFVNGILGRVADDLDAGIDPVEAARQQRAEREAEQAAEAAAAATEAPVAPAEPAGDGSDGFVPYKPAPFVDEPAAAPEPAAEPEVATAVELTDELRAETGADADEAALAAQGGDAE